jgi:replicative DNA helicase
MMSAVSIPSILEKMPPQSIEAEQALLGAMLIEKEAINRALEILDEDDFYKEAHRKIFSAIVRLYERNREVDTITVSEDLRGRGDMEVVGGPGYLQELINSVLTAANAHHYAKIVKDKAIVRNLINAATQVVAQSYEASGDVDELLDKAESVIFGATQHKASKSFSPMRDIIVDSLERVEVLYQTKGAIAGIPTGFYDLDKITSGLQKSDLIVVAARPSMGKTALVLDIAQHMGIEQRLPVAIFSLEMTKEQVGLRMLCSQARINQHKLKTGQLAEEDWGKLTSAARRLSESPIFIDDTPNLSVLEIRAKTRRLASKQGSLGLVVIDYLQLIRGRTKIENRQQEISEISRSLKALARELEVPVISVSQLSRAVEARTDKRPMLSDLRESGAIEQDADLVLLLMRPGYYNSKSLELKGIAEVTIAKQRNGPTGTIPLTFIEEYAKFENCVSP